MNEKSLNDLKKAYKEYLSRLSISSLRLVGRQSGVSQATLKKKDDLVDQIVSVLSGETPPAAKSNRGAPVKDNYVDPRIFEKLQEIKLTYLSGVSGEDSAEFSEAAETPVPENVLDVRSSEFGEEPVPYHEQEVYDGQLEMTNGVACLLPVSGREEGRETILVSVSLIKAHNLREGDVICCHVGRQHAALIATEILSVNGLPANPSRDRFEECEVKYPDERILLSAGKQASSSARFLDWLVPLGKGQRCLISGAPKTGKSVLLNDIAGALLEGSPELRVLVLLVDQSPESVAGFRKAAPGAEFVCTTFDDDPDRQVFMAEFLLKRAKRFAEAGMDVVLLVDSLSALARAAGETERAEAGFGPGPGNRTLHFIRRYFGAARSFIKGGSLTVIGTVSVGTGNPADDFVAGNLAGISNVEIRLDKTLADDRIFPAFDAEASRTCRSELLFSEEERQDEPSVRKYVSAHTNEEVCALVAESETRARFIRSVAAWLSKDKK